MGEEQNEGGENAEVKKEEPQEIVLRVDMHCEGCARKVERSLRKFEGVEDVKMDSKLKTVLVKGKGVDPARLSKRIQRKTGRKSEIISPLPQPPNEEETRINPPLEETKEEPKPITAILKIRMHCEACAQVLQKRIKKMEGVQSVETDIPNEQVIIKGFIDPVKLVENVYRRTRRQASIMQGEEKKDEENSEQKGEEEKTKAGEGEAIENEVDAKKMEYWPPRYNSEYVYGYPPPEVFSDENPNACSIM